MGSASPDQAQAMAAQRSQAAGTVPRYGSQSLYGQAPTAYPATGIKNPMMSGSRVPRANPVRVAARPQF